VVGILPGGQGNTRPSPEHQGRRPILWYRGKVTTSIGVVIYIGEGETPSLPNPTSSNNGRDPAAVFYLECTMPKASVTATPEPVTAATAAPAAPAVLALSDLATQIARWRIKSHDFAVQHFRARNHNDHASWSRFEMALDEVLRCFPW